MGISVEVKAGVPARYDPQGNFNFIVEADGVEMGRFQEISGLTADIETVEFQSGTDRVPRKLPGKPKYANITLKRGLIPRSFSELWQWCENVLKGRPDRRSGSVILLADDGTERLRFNFYFAFPVKWTGFSMNSTSTGAQTIEELELATEFFERA